MHDRLGIEVWAAGLSRGAGHISAFPPSLAKPHATGRWSHDKPYKTQKAHQQHGWQEEEGCPGGLHLGRQPPTLLGPFLNFCFPQFQLPTVNYDLKIPQTIHMIKFWAGYWNLIWSPLCPSQDRSHLFAQSILTLYYATCPLYESPSPFQAVRSSKCTTAVPRFRPHRFDLMTVPKQSRYIALL